MGDPTWYLLIGSISIAVACAIRKIQPFIFQVVLAVLIPGILSVVGACIPEWLNPSPPGEGAFGWTIILAATWAMWAVPTCLVAVTVFHLMKKRRKESSEPNKD
ncbi:MAG: hypothetical protein VB050_12710 [Geobacteraceae bacterium]|nr:hypothetical protein [Geobacteraceae bacterium]